MKPYFCLILLTLFWSTSLKSDELIDTASLFQNPTNYIVGFSPDGEYLASTQIENGKRFLNILNIQSGELKTIANISGAHVNNIDWLSDNRMFLSTRSSGAVKEYILDLDLSKSEESLSFSFIKADGYVLAFLKNRKNNVLYAKRSIHDTSKFLLFLISENDLVKNNFDQAIELTRPTDEVARYFYDSYNQKIIAIAFDDEERKILSKDVDRRGWETLLAIKDSSKVFTPVALKNENTLYVLSNAETDKVAVHEFDISTQTLQPALFEHDKYDIQDLILDPKTLELQAVVYYQNGQRSTEYVQSESKSVKLLNDFFVDTPWNKIAQTSQSSTNDATLAKRYVVKTSPQNASAAYYLFYPDEQKLELISYSYPELEGFEGAKTQTIKVKTKDNIEIEAYFTPSTGP